MTLQEYLELYIYPALVEIHNDTKTTNMLLTEIKALLTPTDSTVSTQETKEDDSGKNDLDKIRDILDVHTGRWGGRS